MCVCVYIHMYVDIYAYNEAYEKIKRREMLIYVTTYMKFKNSMLRGRAKYSSLYTVWFHLYEELERQIYGDRKQTGSLWGLMVRVELNCREEQVDFQWW
jgi:hypothetical protein